MGMVWNYGYNRNFVSEVSKLVTDIQNYKISLSDFSARLIELDNLGTENDALAWYLVRVRESIASTLQHMPDYLFTKCDSYKIYYSNHDYYEYSSHDNSQAFFIALDMLQSELQKSEAIKCMFSLRFGLYRLMNDEPVRTIPVVWAKSQYHALQFFLYAARTPKSVNALLDFLNALPSTVNKRPWVTTFSESSGESLLSLTITYAPERSKEVFAYLETMCDDSYKAVILFHCLRVVSPSPTGWLKNHFENILIPRAENLFSYILELPNKNFIYKILTTAITDYPENNLIIYIIKYSKTIFAQLWETIKSFEAGDDRNHLMQIIFENAMQSQTQTQRLIHFLLSTRDLPKDFLQITTSGSNWNILHIVARHAPNRLSNLLDRIDDIIPEHKDILLAGCTDKDYTPLMIAAAHGPAAVPCLLDAIMPLPNGRAILRQIGLDKSSALTLTNNSHSQTGKLISSAISGKYNCVASSSPNLSFFHSELKDDPVSSSLKDDEESPIKMEAF